MPSNSDQTPLAAVLEELVIVGFYIQQSVVGMLTQTIFFSAYGIFFTVALYSIFRKGLRSRAAIIMLLVVVYLYVASAAIWAMNIWILLTNIHGLLRVPDVPFPDRIELAEAAFQVEGILEAIFVFNMVVGDSVVIWRTWAICHRIVQHRIFVILVPGTLLLLTFIFSIIDTACRNYHSAAPLPGVCNETLPIACGFSAATNIACTIFIGLKARQHRKITGLLGKPSRMSGEKLLSFLFDSGFIYSLIWLSLIIMSVSTTHATLTSPVFYLKEVVVAMSDQMAGFYPTLVIVIVNLRLTNWEEEEKSMPDDTQVQ
ncbi:hypothetical protein B0H11DRAFT_2282996 [Mycena galericulata]|nr:hypothetical protein B0H11DRAFT_2282996 [Mycena galericulata]